MRKPDSLQGSLDLLVLKILSRRPGLHGYAIMTAIADFSEDALKAEEGSCSPDGAADGWIRAEWVTKEMGGGTDYELTAAGKKQLAAEDRGWRAVSLGGEPRSEDGLIWRCGPGCGMRSGRAVKPRDRRRTAIASGGSGRRGRDAGGGAAGVRLGAAVGRREPRVAAAAVADALRAGCGLRVAATAEAEGNIGGGDSLVE